MNKTKLAALAAVLLLLCGCWDYEEINDMSIIAGIGIDKGESPGHVDVCFEILPIPPGKDSPIEPKTSSMQGSSIEDAIYNIAQELSYLPYTDHAWLILFSQEMAEQGIKDYLKAPLTHHDLYMAIYPAIVKDNKASEALDCATVTSPILSYELTNGFEADNREVGKTYPMFIYQVFPILENENVGYLLPAISILEEGDKKLTTNDGCAVGGASMCAQ